MAENSSNVTEDEKFQELRLQREFDDLMVKVNKQKLILSVIKKMNPDDIKEIDDDDAKLNIEKNVHYARAFDYLNTQKDGSTVLGKLEAITITANLMRIKYVLYFRSSEIGIQKPPKLLFTEQKAFKAKLFENLSKKLEKPVTFIQNMDSDAIDTETLNQKIIDEKTRERELYSDLAKKSAIHCNLLKTCHDLKIDNPNLIKHVDLIVISSKIAEAKAG